MRLLDLVGHKYGKLTVIKRQGDRWLCQCDCGNTYLGKSTSIRTGHTSSCGCKKLNNFSGEKSRTWKGGIKKSKRGYVHVMQKDHPRADANGYVLQHILVMEQHLGRYLDKRFTVHHKNGIRNDNRIENLEIRLGNHGPGHTITDTMDDLLYLYGLEKTISMLKERSIGGVSVHIKPTMDWVSMRAEG
jgi:hypothetical protein